MFGSKRRKQQRIIEELATEVANEAFQSIFQTQKECLEVFDKYLSKEEGINYQHGGTAIFFADGTYSSLDFMAYHVGFIFGLCQSKGQNAEEFRVDVLFKFAAPWHEMANDYRKTLKYPKDDHDYISIFKIRYERDLFRKDDAIMNDFTNGLAEGKSYGDFTKSVEKDFSLLKQTNFAANGSLNALKQMFKEWQISILLNRENEHMKRLKAN